MTTKQNILFLGSVCFLFWFYSYLDIPILRPVSIHTWRQCDCASIALNYYQHDMNFLHPEVNNNLEFDGKNYHGYSVEELPWLYYLIAVLYKVFGFHEWFFRVMTMLIFILGLYALFRLSLILLGDSFISLLVSIFAFSFPVVSYYAYNYLPNLPALALDWIGLYFFVRFIKLEKVRDLAFFTVIYMFCGLTKVSSLISFVAIGSAFVLSFLDKDRNSVFIRFRKFWLLSFVFVILSNIGWYAWAKHYNTIHPNGLFLTGILPIWNMSRAQISDTISKVENRWSYFYAFPKDYLLLSVLVIFVFIKWKILPLIYRRFFLFWLLGFVFYVILFFDTFAAHDYYTICLFTLPVITLIFSLYILKGINNNTLKSPLVKIALSILVIANCIYTRHVLVDKYYGSELYQTNGIVYDNGFIDYLHKLKITYPQNVFILPDYTPNVSLYLTNLRGWTNFPNSEEDSISIGSKVNVVNYMIILDTNYAKRKWIAPFTDFKIGAYKGCAIYSLVPYRK